MTNPILDFVLEPTNGISTITRKELYALVETVPTSTETHAYKAAKALAPAGPRGSYFSALKSKDAPKPRAPKNVVPMAPPAPTVSAENDFYEPTPDPVETIIATVTENLVPKKNKNYVRWGRHTDIVSIIKSGQFMPTFVSGLSGNGKTMMVEQACAQLGRECVRVQITPETDEDDLMGGFRLEGGSTVFEKGPVIMAMERGAILLLDEIDRGSNRLMCLQGVLEGKPVLLKKIKELVEPAEGFNVIATANTKGQGSIDGRFAAATVIDEAFLERFALTIDQDYPSAAIETKIINGTMGIFNVNNDEMTDRLVTWAGSIRKMYNEGELEELITTRRLCHIVQAFSIFGNEMKAVEFCVSRFDADTKDTFVQYYSKLISTIPTEDDAARSDADEDFTSPF